MKLSSNRTYLRNAVKISNVALTELKKEHFNSKTMRLLFYDKRFISNDKDKTIVVSRKTGDPETIYKSIFTDINFEFKGKNIDYYDLDLYVDKAQKCKIGHKHFTMEHSPKGLKMCSGYMETNENDLDGLGIREDQFHIETAIENGIETIPRLSYPKALLYHLRIGFSPVQQLKRVWNKTGVQNLLQITIKNAKTVEEDKFTPIIIEKRALFWKRYYFDKNTTLALAYLRKIKETLATLAPSSRMKEFGGDEIEMELSGYNMQVWENMLAGKGMP